MIAGYGVRRLLDRICVVLAVGGMAAMLAQTLPAQEAAPGQIVASTPPGKVPARQNPHEQSEGERVFAAHCSRCHTAPDRFPQRISGTVVRHMRIRASLSEQEEQALLRFFYPQ